MLRNELIANEQAWIKGVLRSMSSILKSSPPWSKSVKERLSHHTFTMFELNFLNFTMISIQEKKS